MDCSLWFPVWPKLVQYLGLPRWLSGKESACQCRRHGFTHWVGNIPWRRKWKPTPVFLPGKFHGQSSLVGCSCWGCKRAGLYLVPTLQQQWPQFDLYCFLLSADFRYCLFLFQFFYKVFEVCLIFWGRLVLLWTAFAASCRFIVVFSLSFFSYF